MRDNFPLQNPHEHGRHSGGGDQTELILGDPLQIDNSRGHRPLGVFAGGRPPVTNHWAAVPMDGWQASALT